MSVYVRLYMYVHMYGYIIQYVFRSVQYLNMNYFTFICSAASGVDLSVVAVAHAWIYLENTSNANSGNAVWRGTILCGRASDQAICIYVYVHIFQYYILTYRSYTNS